MRIALAGDGRLAGPDRAARLAVHDPDYRMPGRGAYLCRGAHPATPAPACLAQALRRGGIARALRTAVTVDPKLVESVSR
jgi:predicted RNA-binding protein YlxR (DUF448 family)